MEGRINFRFCFQNPIDLIADQASPDAELGMELVASQNAARDTMDLAGDLPARLPRTWAAVGAGLIDEYRARLIWRPTRCLSDADAAHADEVLSALAVVRQAEPRFLRAQVDAAEVALDRQELQASRQGLLKVLEENPKHERARALLILATR